MRFHCLITIPALSCSIALDRCYPKPFSFSHGSFSRRSPWDGPSGPHTDPLMLGVVDVAVPWAVMPWTGCVSSTCFISENTFSWWFCKRLGKVCLRPVCFLKWVIFLRCCSPPNLLSFYSFCKFLQHCNQNYQLNICWVKNRTNIKFLLRDTKLSFRQL